MPDQTSRIGADVGGTFTDVIALDADGTARITKVLSTRSTRSQSCDGLGTKSQ